MLRLVFLFLFSISFHWQAVANEVLAPSLALDSKAYVKIVNFLNSVPEVKKIRSVLKPGEKLYVGGSGAVLLTQAALSERNSSLTLKQLLGSTSDLDLYYNRSLVKLKGLRQRLRSTNLNFDWDLVTLFEENNRGLVGNANWQMQNTDSISTGLILLSENKAGDDWPLIVDTRSNADSKGFLHSLKEATNIYFDSSKHFETQFYQTHRNPKVVSAVKFIINTARFNLSAGDEDLEIIKSIIADFNRDFDFSDNHEEDGPNSYVQKRLFHIIAKSVHEMKTPERLIELFYKTGLDQLFSKLTGLSKSSFWPNTMDHSGARIIQKLLSQDCGYLLSDR